MTINTRQHVRDAYSKSGRQYDQVREQDRRGELLSRHDIALFNQMLPDDLVDLRIVEIGAGTGRFTLPMLERGLSLTATDINEAMLDELRQKIEAADVARRCDVQLEDVFNLSFSDASIDFIVCLHVIPRLLTLEDQRAAILEIARTMKPGGRLLFNYRNAKSHYAVFHKGHTTTPRQMEGVLADAGLRVTSKRGKHLLNRRLLNKLPLVIGRGIAAADRALWRFQPDRAWDVFVFAEKLGV